MLEISRLIAEVKEKDDVRILPGDPAFALVTLNRLTLEDLATRLGEGVRAGIAEFNEAVEITETRAGRVLAQQVREAAAAFREEVQRDINAARLQAEAMVRELDESHNRISLVGRGLAIFTSLTTVFFAGVWAGIHYLR